MANEQTLPDQLWAVFKLLEMANLEAVRTKRQVALVANPDPSEGGDVILTPCRFVIDGQSYGAMISAEQQALIQETIANGTAKEVLELIAYDFLIGHLYPAAQLVSNILVTALKNQAMPTETDQLRLKQTKTPVVGACTFPNGNCQSNCGAPLCVTLGGTPCESCDSIGP